MRRCNPIVYCILVVALVVQGCGGADEKHISDMLAIILKDDLQAIISDIPEENLVDSVYYSIISFETFAEGRYSKKAVVDFYFLKNVKTKILRKYRFEKKLKKWDRYYNEYKFY